MKTSGSSSVHEEVANEGQLDTKEMSEQMQSLFNNYNAGRDIKKTTMKKIDANHTLVTWEYDDGETFSVTLQNETEDRKKPLCFSDCGPLVNTGLPIYRNPITKAFKDFVKLIMSITGRKNDNNI